jgi:hypothetical protein
MNKMREMFLGKIYKERLGYIIGKVKSKREIIYLQEMRFILPNIMHFLLFL